MKLGLQQHMKTEVKTRNLNPRYDETFDLLVYERSVEVREEAARLCLIWLLLLIWIITGMISTTQQQNIFEILSRVFVAKAEGVL